MIVGIIVNNILRDNVSQIKDVYNRYELGEKIEDDIVIDPYKLDQYFPIATVSEKVADFDPDSNEIDFESDDVNTEELTKTIYDIIYTDAAFEVFARAHESVNGIVKKFSTVRENCEETKFVVINIESPVSKNATLAFLGTKSFNMDSIIFPDTYEKVWDNCDLLITDHPDILKYKPDNKMCIKLRCPSNEQYRTEYQVDNVEDIFELEIIKKLK